VQRLCICNSEYNFGNFFIGTVANYTRCEVPDRHPDFVSFSGSAYWDLGDRVRRYSDHWGPYISTCCWYLDFKDLKLKYSLCGECYYEEFRPVRWLDIADD
jgi:hypothetical protein